MSSLGLKCAFDCNIEVLILPLLAAEGKTLDSVVYREYLNEDYMRGNGGILDKDMY